MLQRNPHPSIDGDRLPWPKAGWIGQEWRRVGKGRDVKQRAGGIVALIEDILGKAIDLEILAHLVGRVQTKDRVARDLRKLSAAAVSLPARSSVIPM